MVTDNNGFSEYDLGKLEDGRKPFDISNLRAERMEEGVYQQAHSSLPLVCHDVFIQYQGGILLVHRDNVPAKGELWPIGGRVQRGVLMEDSLRAKSLEECGLSLDDFRFMGVERTLFETDPFGHGKGTDTVNLVYSARGRGQVNLDNLHTRPRIVSYQDYLSMRGDLHPYVQEHMDALWSGGSPELDPEGLIKRGWKLN